MIGPALPGDRSAVADGHDSTIPMKKVSSITLVALIAFGLSYAASAIDHAAPNIIEIDARQQTKVPPAPLPGMGGTSPDGHEIGVNSQYLTLDGRPWLPVMGEFHYSRYPEQYWEEELLKMKAGGVQIVSTYVFWIHHEEIQGQFDWSGQRNLRHFVELCKKHNLYVFLRIGPYAHGEVRNGGLPDWVVTAGSTRRNDRQYLSYVHRYFGEIGQQVKGFLWKDGGPIIDIQLENEYSQRGSDAGEAHISELKKIAQTAGLVTPMYTVTGWDNAAYPPDEVIPVFGGYVDNFWDSSLKDLPPAGYYLFEELRASAADAGQNTSTISYPFFMAEAGGGMQVAYHRRPLISGDDVAAMTLTRLGSGVNLYGYYMFQGGANPDGKLTSLQESVETDHVYDLPRVSYDFQAPLGQYGQMKPPFRATKPFHMFLNDFGSDLAPMTTFLPQGAPADPNDRATLRVAARVRGNSGFVFINNYQRMYPLPDHPHVQIELVLPSERLLLPRTPAHIASGAYFLWPVNLDLDGTVLKYATAQLLTKIRDRGVDYYVFFAQPGIAAEFAFDQSTVASIHSGRAAVSRSDGRIYVDTIEPRRETSFSVRSRSGRITRVVLLSQDEAEDSWKVSTKGREHLVLTKADVFSDDQTLHLRARRVEDLRFSIFPRLVGKPEASVTLVPTVRSALFAGYSARIQPKQITAPWRRIRVAAAAAPPRLGKYNAAAPTDADFEQASAWNIEIPPNSLSGLSDVFLRIDYTGDVARLYFGRRLLDDDFYKGTEWEIGMKRFITDRPHRQTLTLQVLPRHKDAPIYIPRDPQASSPPSAIANVARITCSPEYEIRVRVR
jgi:beta-galactosidase